MYALGFVRSRNEKKSNVKINNFSSGFINIFLCIVVVTERIYFLPYYEYGQIFQMQPANDDMQDPLNLEVSLGV